MIDKRAIHVLIVEDNPDQALALKLMLETRKEALFTTETAFTAASAIVRLEDRGNQFQVVMLDLNMPDGNGPCLVEKIKKAAPDVRVVCYTGWADPTVASRSKVVGADDVIVKPGDPAHIVKVLQWQVIHKQSDEDSARMKKILREIGVEMKEGVAGEGHTAC